MSPRDAASITENPPFLSTTGSNANFLHIDPTIATQIESGAVPIAGITDDYDGEMRNATTPDIGADEGTFILADFVGPVISYTPARQLDEHFDPQLHRRDDHGPERGQRHGGNAAPRLLQEVDRRQHVRRQHERHDGWKYVEANGGSSPFDFTIDYSLLFGGGGSSLGDVIQYFVVAQDLAGTPNVGINSGTFATTPAVGEPDRGELPDRRARSGRTRSSTPL